MSGTHQLTHQHRSKFFHWQSFGIDIWCRCPKWQFSLRKPAIIPFEYATATNIPSSWNDASPNKERADSSSVCAKCTDSACDWAFTS
jgi:hypothetical protein